MSKSGLCKFMFALMLLAVSGLAWTAVVTSNAISGSASRNSAITIPLKIKSATPVAGINGEFDFDTTYFSSPSISVGPGAQGFIALGNLTSPGHYKFVIYSDPTKTMNLSLVVAQFQVKTAPKITKSVVSQITFPAGLTPPLASSDANAVSLSTTLSAISIKLQGNGANDWVLYE